MRKTLKTWKKTLLMTGAFFVLLTGCGTAEEKAGETEKGIQEERGAQDKAQEKDAQEKKEKDEASRAAAKEEREQGAEQEGTKQEAAEALLLRAVDALESQLPELNFEDMDRAETDRAVSFFKDSYVFAGRKADSGYSYILGICTAEGNPLEGMTCGQDRGGEGYSASQFADGRILLLEKDAPEYGLSWLYDSLNQGKAGIEKLEEEKERGVLLIPPGNGPFLRVFMVRDGSYGPEYLPLSEAQAQALSGESAAAAKAGENIQSAVSLFDSREAMEESGLEAPGIPLTAGMKKLAKEALGFETGSLESLGEIRSAALTGSFETGRREETLGNRDDLERLRGLLLEAEPSGTPVNQSFPGRLVLTLASGEQLTVWLSDAEGDGAAPELSVGSSSFYTLDKETAKELWRLFGTVDGFRRYGDQIWMEMTKEEFSPEDPELTFILHNETGGPIYYILSPVIEKQTGVSAGDAENGAGVYGQENGSGPEGGGNGGAEWSQVESIAGFCGFLTELSGSEAELSVPWKGSFSPDGAGTYRLSIQVLPEEELRFGVGAQFELTEESADGARPERGGGE